MSLQDHREPKILTADKTGMSDLAQTRRGWWDYVPEPPTDPRGTMTPGPKSNSDHSGIIQVVGNRLQKWSYPPSDAHAVLQRKPSLPGDYPIPHPYHTPSIVFNGRLGGSSSHDHERMRTRARTRSPPPPSVMSRLSKYMPRMQLFREVLKNEVSWLEQFIFVLLTFCPFSWRIPRFSPFCTSSPAF